MGGWGGGGGGDKGECISEMRMGYDGALLKVTKCEKFHRTDFFDFFTIKPLWVGDFRAKIKN